MAFIALVLLKHIIIISSTSNMIINIIMIITSITMITVAAVVYFSLANLSEGQEI